MGVLVFEIGDELAQFVEVSGAADRQHRLFIGEIGEQVDFHRLAELAELREFNRGIGGFELIDRVDHPGVQVARGYIALRDGEGFADFIQLGLDGLGAAEGVLDDLEFLGGRRFLLRELGEAFVLVPDQRVVEADDGHQGEQDDQDQLVAFFLGEFAEVHRVTSG